MNLTKHTDNVVSEIRFATLIPGGVMKTEVGPRKLTYISQNLQLNSSMKITKANNSASYYNYLVHI
jgi:hypothetical protein